MDPIKAKMKRNGASTLTIRLWEMTGTALVNLFVFLLLFAYLSPMAYMLITSVKTSSQLQDSKAPIYPAESEKFQYEGRALTVYYVPTPEGTKHWAMYKPFRQYSEFVDPQNPEAGIIRWEGNWRQLKPIYHFSVTFDNFRRLWTDINYPLLIFNTLAVALIGGVGVLLSSIVVAYGFARFRIPFGKFLFFLLIATILIPDSITLIPTYFIFVRIFDWNGTWLPLILPHFFANAVFVFLLRQNFKSLPRDLDEAAMIDGASPMRILFSVILPQSVPVVVTVSLLHLFYVWNELRSATLYLGIAQDLQTVSFTVQAFQVIGFTPEMLQTSAILLISVPVIILFLAQRFFMKDMVVTGLEK